ncbi:hypothetical protein MRX96_029747 [Rhipicephalus microplus]
MESTRIPKIRKLRLTRSSARVGTRVAVACRRVALGSSRHVEAGGALAPAKLARGSSSNCSNCHPQRPLRAVRRTERMKRGAKCEKEIRTRRAPTTMGM